MPKRTHEHREHHKASSQEGFIANDIKRAMNKRSLFTNSFMNKNEKIIMGVLVGGIILFLALSILVLYSKSRDDAKNANIVPTSGSEKVLLTPYPTIPPVINMTVMMNSRRFNPSSTTIPKGGYIDFFNIGPDPITIEANDPKSAILNLGTIESSDDKSVTFNTPGIYTYRNKAKPKVTGIIIIK